MSPLDAPALDLLFFKLTRTLRAQAPEGAQWRLLEINLGPDASDQSWARQIAAQARWVQFDLWPSSTPGSPLASARSAFRGAWEVIAPLREIMHERQTYRLKLTTAGELRVDLWPWHQLDPRPRAEGWVLPWDPDLDDQAALLTRLRELTWIHVPDPRTQEDPELSRALDILLQRHQALWARGPVGPSMREIMEPWPELEDGPD